MKKIGYAHLVDSMQLDARPLARYAQIASSVNRRQDTNDRILFPSGVAINDTDLGHLEFAIRHEGINLEVINAAFDKLEPGLLIERLRDKPTGEAIRRLCFLWEWMKGESLNSGVAPSGNYVDLFPVDVYAVAAKPIKSPAYRVNDNALGNSWFCPVVRRNSLAHSDALYTLLKEAPKTFAGLGNTDQYSRALTYLYLSETRNSFAIEKEVPSASKEERFVQLLAHAGLEQEVTEEWMVTLQNTVIRDAYSQEASYRTRQNWLANSANRVTFLPPPPDVLPQLMRGWEAFVNDKEKGIDLSIKIACAAFGFVYMHPFMDGNGRLHRFVIHHVLQQSGLLPAGVILPVSAAIKNEIPDYHAVLNGFSAPVTQLWDYKRANDEPLIEKTPGARPYRYFEADREVQFMQRMIQTTILTEMPNEIRYLAGYDRAYEAIDRALDLPAKDISALIRMIHGHNGSLSGNKRKQYAHLPDDVITQIEGMVREAFAEPTDEAPEAADSDEPSDRSQPGH